MKSVGRSVSRRSKNGFCQALEGPGWVGLGPGARPAASGHEGQSAFRPPASRSRGHSRPIWRDFPAGLAAEKAETALSGTVRKLCPQALSYWTHRQLLVEFSRATEPGCGGPTVGGSIKIQRGDCAMKLTVLKAALATGTALYLVPLAALAQTAAPAQVETVTVTGSRVITNGN